jgi:hypothetical protein
MEMKVIVPAIALAIGLTTAARADVIGGTESGWQFMRQCSGPAALLQFGACGNYVGQVVALLGSNRRYAECLPPQLTGHNALLITQRYAQTHPYAQSRAAFDLVRAALDERFGCR